MNIILFFLPQFHDFLLLLTKDKIFLLLVILLLILYYGDEVFYIFNKKQNINQKYFLNKFRIKE